jgi:hypothetical protein
MSDVDARITGARQASDRIVAHMVKARGLFPIGLLSGSCGLCEPAAVERDLRAASAELEAALALLTSTDWPCSADRCVKSEAA